MGKSDAEHIEFWTKSEYDKFISVVDKDDKYYVLFEILFWCGVRIGEALALTLDDIDFDKNEIHISKTYYRLKRKDVITAPKTKTSVRVVTAPEFLMSEIKAYADRLYKYPTDARLFPVVAKAVENVFKRYTEKAGVKKIRIHDLRHSHVSYLINQGVEPLLIKERLGHTDIRITLNTYGHLYPNRQRALGEMLNEKK
jgi:integrase